MMKAEIKGAEALSNEQYHSSPGISSTHLKTLYKYSPYYYNRIWPLEKKLKPKDALVFGNFVHTFILEPDKLHDEFEQIPQGLSRATKTFKEMDKAAKEKGKQMIKYEDWVLAEMMARGFEGEPAAVQMRDASIIESSYFWSDNETSELLKTRADMILQDIIIDLKTCSDIDQFQMDMSHWNYDLQGGHYTETPLESGPAQIFILVAVEKKAPFRCRVYEFQGATLQAGKGKFRDSLDTLHQCKLNNEWPTYSGGVIQV